MSFITLNVEIDHGKIVVKGTQTLPEKVTGVLIIPAQLTQPRPIGLAKGEFVVPDDFNAPLAEEVLKQFEGK